MDSVRHGRETERIYVLRDFRAEDQDTFWDIAEKIKEAVTDLDAQRIMYDAQASTYRLEPCPPRREPAMVEWWHGEKQNYNVIGLSVILKGTGAIQAQMQKLMEEVLQFTSDPENNISSAEFKGPIKTYSVGYLRYPEDEWEDDTYSKSLTRLIGELKRRGKYQKDRAPVLFELIPDKRAIRIILSGTGELQQLARTFLHTFGIHPEKRQKDQAIYKIPATQKIIDLISS